MSNDYTPAEGDNTEMLDEPIKVRWTGYARSRIGEYNADFDDEGWSERTQRRPSRFVAALSRQKTQVVIATLGEAASVYAELGNYSSDQRGWMNSSMDRSLGLVRRKVDDAMAERGYRPVFDAGLIGYFPAEEAERRQNEIDARRAAEREEREHREKVTGEVYSRVRSQGARNCYSHSGVAKIVFRHDAVGAGPAEAARLLELAGCDNVSIETETDERVGWTNRDPVDYEVVAGDIPDVGYGGGL
jgi:hypothetical protein